MSRNHSEEQTKMSEGGSKLISRREFLRWSALAAKGVALSQVSGPTGSEAPKEAQLIPLSESELSNHLPNYSTLINRREELMALMDSSGAGREAFVPESVARAR